jgi:hypothetical protein
MFNQSVLFLCFLSFAQIAIASAPAASQLKSSAEQPQKRIVSKAHSAALQQALFEKLGNKSNATATATVAWQSDELAKAIAENLELRKQLAKEEKQKKHYFMWMVLFFQSADLNNLLKSKWVKPEYNLSVDFLETTYKKLQKSKLAKSPFALDPAAFIEDDSDQLT